MHARGRRLSGWTLLLLLATMLPASRPARAQTVNIPVNIVAGAWAEGTGGNRALATFTDPGCAPGVSYTALITWGDGARSRVGSGPGISGSCFIGFTVHVGHVYPEEGTYQLSVAVFGSEGSAGNGSAPIPVADAAIVLTEVARIEPPGVAFSVSVARFTDGDAFASVGDYTARIDWGDGSTSAGTMLLTGPSAFDVVGSHTYAASGSYSVPVTVHDAGGASASVTSILLAGAAIVSGGDTIRTTEGKPFAGEVATFADTRCGASVVYSATVDWGDGATSAGSISGSCNGGFAVQGTHTYAEGGSYTLRVPISGTNDSGGTATGTAAVTDAPLAGTGTAISATQGSAFGKTLGTFSDSGPNSGRTDFTASVDWGDGSPASPGTVSGGPGAGPYTVTGSHTYFAAGTKRISLTVTDAGGATTALRSTATVGSSSLSVFGGSVVAVEGTPAALAGAAFTDPSCTATDVYAVLIDWGDGTAADSLAIGPGSSCASGQPIAATHLYRQAGSFSVAITVSSRTNGRGGIGSGNALIGGAAIAAGTTAALTLSEGQPFSGPVAVFADANAAAHAADFAAAIEWGDGTPNSAGTVAASDGGFSVAGSHVYTEQGSFPLTVSLSGSDGRVVVSSSTASVAEVAVLVAAPALSATAGASFSGVVGTFSDPGHPAGLNADLPLEFAATIAWGDGSTGAGTVALISGNVYTVSGVHVYSGDTSGPLAVTVTHHGTAAAGTGSADIAGAPTFVVPGTEFAGATATFTDADPTRTARSFRASIDWGDGTVSDGSIAGPDGGEFTVTGKHIYDADGDFTITTTISRNDGTTRSVTLLVTVEGQGPAPRAASRQPRPPRPPRHEAKPASVQTQASSLAALAANDIVVQEGETFEQDVAAFVDPECGRSRYSATISWGDGTSSRGKVEGHGLCIFTVGAKHGYAVAGDYQVAIQIHGGSGRRSAVELSVAVDDAPLVSWSATVWAATGARLTHTTVAYFHDGDRAGVTDNYTATIDWGDAPGATPATVARHPAFGDCTHPCFAVSGAHVYNKEGAFPLTMTIADAGGATTTATGEADVFAGAATDSSFSRSIDERGTAELSRAIAPAAALQAGRRRRSLARRTVRRRGSRLSRNRRSPLGRRT